jgi:hypothetical protein
MKRHFKFARFTVLACLTVLVFVTAALAGPPLICHPFDIGKEKSLPWTGTSWNLSGNEGYETSHLSQDTLDLLDTKMPVIVRMETLRRATLYAGKDLKAAKELLTRLHARANAAENTKSPDALALFDFGYLVETYNQGLRKDQNPAAGVDGYAFVKNALALRGNNPEMEFAAALITLGRAQAEHEEHVRKAMAGAKSDPLLSRNLAKSFLGNEKQSVAEALARK